MKIALYIAMFLLLPWLVLAVGALLLNQASLAGTPGAMQRLALYLGENIAEMNDAPRLPELRARAYPRAVEPLAGLVRQAANQLGWRVTGEDLSAGRLDIVVTTALFGFNDDIAVRIDAGDDGQSVLYLRSSSRVGKGDFGANRRHVLALADTVSRLLAEEASP